MSDLKHSKVYRGGVTAPDLSFETNQCSATVNQLEGSIDIEFNLASKGGGTTHVLLQIGKDDWQVLLREIANKTPESAGMLSDCAALANRKNLELLEQARKVREAEKTRVKSLVEGLVDDLGSVEEFVSQKYFEAPADADETEAQTRNRIWKVIGALRELL